MGAYLVQMGLAIGLIASAEPQSLQSPALLGFEFLGCSGLVEDYDEGPQAWRLTADNKVNFLVQSHGTCGQVGRSPSVKATSEGLDLSYELYDPGGKVVMCDCVYWARFSFSDEALRIGAVSFRGRPVDLRGHWPGD